MRTLTQTLLAAQRASSRLPYVKVEVVDRVAGVGRLCWERLYSGSEADFHHAAAVPGDGSLVRARVDTSYQLYRQRVAGPGPGSDFASWTAMGVVSDVSGIALAGRGASVLLFYVAPDQQTVNCRESADYGAAFGAATAVVTAGAAVGWLAAAISPSDVAALFYSVGGIVYVMKRSNGAWGSPAAWIPPSAGTAAIAVVYQGDWNLALCGQDSAGNNKTWTCVYGDGYSRNPGVWSAPAALALASPGSNVEFRCPSLDFPGVCRVFFVEKYTGAASYSRPLWTHSLASAGFVDNLWREPAPFDLSSSYGVAIAHYGSDAWLCSPSGVWRAGLGPASVEITADVTGLLCRVGPRSGKAEIRLRNDDGRYGTPGSGDYAAIKQGSELLISPGYRTAAGLEVSDGPAFWIEGWEHVSRGGEAGFILRAEDGWGLLGRWKARRQFAWPAGDRNIFQLLRFILARAGLELSALSNSSALVDRYPAFTVHPGESGVNAAGRLLQMAPDVLFFRGSCGYLLDPQSSDESVYSYGDAHAVHQGRYLSLSPGVTRAQVFGSGVFAEGFDWDGIDNVYDRLYQVFDLNLDIETAAQQRVDAELRRSGMAALGGEIVVPANCGQELYDVIDITDERAGLESARRRVIGLDLRYSPGTARYEQTITLGGV